MTTEATTEKKPSNRIGHGNACNVFDDAQTKSHYRTARFLGYLGVKLVKGKKMSLAKVVYDNGGLACVDRKLVEKTGF